MSSLPLRPGDPERLGDYELVGRLGAGGMGTVYLGRSAQGRPVAIKVVRTEFTRDEEFLGRFRSEVNRARQVPPFCTAEVLDADPDHDPPYLVVEYVDGPNLTDIVRDKGPLSPAALHSAAVGIATALTAIHGAGVIHRDLKPGNVLFAMGGLKVIDFGIARPLEATSQHTRTDQMVGTVAYMAPERFDEAPSPRVSPAADIFAWGAVVTFAGTGRTPFAADSAPATAMRILTQQPELGKLPVPLRGIVARTLSKEPADRPTARELLDLLLAAGQPSGSLPPRPVPDDRTRLLPEYPGPAGAPQDALQEGGAPEQPGQPTPVPPGQAVAGPQGRSAPGWAGQPEAAAPDRPNAATSGATPQDQPNPAWTAATAQDRPHLAWPGAAPQGQPNPAWAGAAPHDQPNPAWSGQSAVVRPMASDLSQSAGPGGAAVAQPRRGRAVKRVAVAVVALVALGGIALFSRAQIETSDAGDTPAAQTGASPGATGESSRPAPGPTGNAGVLAGTRRTLIHFVEIDRDLAMPYPDEVVASDGTGKDALFALVPTGVDFMIQSMKPTEGEPPCLGVKVIPDGSASLVATECAATKATLFAISATGDKDDKNRPTYTIYNDAHGAVQWYEAKSQVYVEHLGDAQPDTTFSFVDRGPL